MLANTRTKGSHLPPLSRILRFAIVVAAALTQPGVAFKQLLSSTLFTSESNFLA